MNIKRIWTLESIKNHKVCLFIIYFHILCINHTSNVVRTYIIWCSYTFGNGTYAKSSNWCKRWRESLQNHQNEWMESAGTFCRHANIVTDRFQCTQRGLSTDEGWFLERNRSGILIMILRNLKEISRMQDQMLKFCFIFNLCKHETRTFKTLKGSETIVLKKYGLIYWF